jgi:Nif-specific regulatory protein
MTEKKKKNPRKSAGRKTAADLLDDLEVDLTEDSLAASDAVDLHRRIKELEASKSTFEALLNISASISSSFNQREILKQIIDAVIRTTDCDRGFLMLRNDRGDYSFEISRSKDEKELSEDVFEVSRSIVEEAAESGEPVPLKNIRDSKHFKTKESVMALNLESAYAVPLKYEDKLIGIIYVDSKSMSERFTTADLPVLKAFGAQAAVAIKNARRRNELELSLRNLKKRLAGRFEYSGIIGKSQAMRDVIQSVEKYSLLPGVVFIQGESGVGKELVANAIHYHSERSNNKFLAINCGSLNESLLETTLFGCIKGAYTDAKEDREGAFESTNHGTLFLDEITETSPKLQSSLLRALESGQISRVGETKSRNVDVRVLAATNRDLKKEVEAGRFRSDLYYRLYVLTIHVPPLRERPEDIPVLTEHFFSEFSALLKKTRPELSEDAVNFLTGQKWPGNVRELKNLIIRTLSNEMDRDVIDAKTLRRHLDQKETGLIGEDGASLKEKLQAAEAEIIRQALLLHSGNVTHAAEELGISRQVLHNKINKYKLSGKT